MKHEKYLPRLILDNGFQDDEDGFDESTDELYLPDDFPAPQNELPYVDISALLYKVNGLAGDELSEISCLKENYAAARPA